LINIFNNLACWGTFTIQQASSDLGQITSDHNNKNKNRILTGSIFTTTALAAVVVLSVSVLLLLLLLPSFTTGITNTLLMSNVQLNLAYASSKPINSHNVHFQGEVHLRNFLNITKSREQEELHVHRPGTPFGLQTLNNIKLRTEFLKTLGNVPTVVQELKILSSISPSVPFELPFWTLNMTSSRQANNNNSDASAIPTTSTTTASSGVAAMTTASVQPVSTETSAGFSGLSEGQIGSYYDPPDVQVAVGPSYVMEMNNLEGKTFTKTGGSVSTFSLYSFFGISGGDEVSDPRIMYDAGSGRWFASVSDITQNTVKVAVSTSSTPSSFRIFVFKFSNCPDYPTIGLNDDKFAVSANLFAQNCNGGYAGVQYYVINKSYMIGSTSTPVYSRSSPNNSIFALQPVQALSSSSTLFMVTVGDDLSTSARVYSFSNPPSTNNVPTSIIKYTIHTTHIPPNALQRGTSNQLDTEDARILDAAWYQGKLWLTFNDACTPSGDVQVRSCARLTQINTSTNSLKQDIDVGAKSAYYFYPALRMDGSSNLLVVFGGSSLSLYPTIYATGQDAAGGALDITPMTLKAGTYPELTNRFGDYFGAAVDPSNASVVWGAGEYHSSYYWSTFIAAMLRQ